MPTASRPKSISLTSKPTRRVARLASTPDRQTTGGPPIWLLAALLAIATFVAYSPVVRYPFVSLDDVDYVTENQHVQQGLSLSTVSWALTATAAGNWHPLTWMSHAFDCDLFGLDASGHHLTNLLFHIANSILISV